jgi:hypothetical protein
LARDVPFGGLFRIKRTTQTCPSAKRVIVTIPQTEYYEEHYETNAMATVNSPSSPDTSPELPHTIPVHPSSSSTTTDKPILLPTQVSLLS